MAGIKITDLPAVPSAQLSDVFPVDQLPGPVTYKESNQQLLTLFEANIVITPSNFSGILPVANGGTSVSSFTPYSVICGGTTLTGPLQSVVGLGNIGEQLTSNGPGALPTWQTGTAVTPSALTRVDDTNVTLTLGGSPSTALLQAVSITAGWAGLLSLARGGTNKNITPDNGALVYCDADSFELLAATATAGQIPRSGANSAPTWSTATYPSAAGTSGNVLTSDGTNWNSSALPAGVSSITGTANQVIASASTGAVTLSTPQDIAITSAVRFASVRLSNTGLLDNNGVQILGLAPTASAVDFVTLVNQIAGAAPGFVATGTSTNIDFGIESKGTGLIQLLSRNLTNPVAIFNGTSAQHRTNFLFANTANTRNITFPDADGTLLMTGQAISTVPSISFGGTALANYVEGTWTPTVTLVGGAGNTVPVYVTNSAIYTRIGNTVFCDVSLDGDGGAEGAGTGQINIALPIAASAANIGFYSPVGVAVNGASSYSLQGAIGSSASVIILNYFSLISTQSTFTGVLQNSTSRTIKLKFFYTV